MQQNQIVSVPGVAIGGVVHGGNQLVSGSTIQLYAAGSTGYGSAATPLISSVVTTDANGSFNIGGDYTCPSATTQVYITATGGNPGMTSGTNNGALALMTALGNCGNLNSGTHVIINEVTTVAAVWPLAQFMAGYANVGASSTNSAGLTRAFENSAAIASSTSGVATPIASYNGNPEYPTNYYPQYTLNTLANALSACVNSNGSTATGMPCQLLFAAATSSGVAAPTDTVGAALNIALHPGVNVGAVYSVATANAPFQPTLAAAPNDWTVYITFQEFLKFFESATMDASGNFRAVTQYYNSDANAIGPLYTGALDLGGTGAYSVAFDAAGNAWSDVYAYSLSPTHTQVSVETPSGTAVGTYAASVLKNPGDPIAFDSLGNAWIVDANGEYVLSPSGAVEVSGAPPFYSPVADASGNMWNMFSSTLDKATVSGSSIVVTPVVTITGAISFLGFDHNDDAVVLTSSGLSKYNSSGMLVSSIPCSFAGTLDGDGNLWSIVDNAGSYSLVEYSSACTALSPSTGYGAYVSANVAADAGINAVYQPSSMGMDESGDVWLVGPSNSIYPYQVYGYTVTEFLGAAAPILTPMSLAAASNKLGARP